MQSGDGVCVARHSGLGARLHRREEFGNQLAGEVLFDYVIGTAEPEETTPCDINVIGEYNVAGEMWQVTPLFTRLGIRVLAPITGDARFRQVAGAHRARVNMVVCSQAMVSLARAMQERWGIPFFEDSFYGIGDTSAALRTLAHMLVERGAEPALIERTEALIASEEARTWAALAPYRARLAGKRVLLYTGGVKSWSVVLGAARNRHGRGRHLGAQVDQRRTSSGSRT